MNRAVVASAIAVLLAAAVLAQEEGELPFRRMDYYCWQEFREVVPSRCDTVILPVGTQEAHGVIANGADALVPERLAMMVAPQANALVAPTVHYGLTTTLAAYPGGFAISRSTFKTYCLEVADGLAQSGFRNLIIFNGHGPNRAPLDEVAAEVSARRGVRVLVVNWWAYCAELTQEIWGPDQDGGHAALNENAAVQAVDPRFVRQRYYTPDLAVPIDSSYTVYPHTGTILLYTEGVGYPDFDQELAERYLTRVAEELAALIVDARRRWDAAGL